jgi:L-fucose mutarotase/ribose pyranase (RbsD/FucU family)
MLKRIDFALSADFLWMLAAMGHGDDVALVDARDSDAAPKDHHDARREGRPIHSVGRRLLARACGQTTDNVALEEDSDDHERSDRSS